MAEEHGNEGRCSAARTVPIAPWTGWKRDDGRLSTAADIALALGAKGRGPRWSARCPAHDDNSPSLSIGIGNDGRILLHCFSGCAFPAIVTALRHDLGLRLDNGRDRLHQPDLPLPAWPRRTRPHADASSLWMTIWHETVGLAGSPGEAYLRGRLGGMPGDLPDLRYHHACPRARGRLPALVGLLRHAVTNEPTGIQRTYLARRADGAWTKADLEPDRMMLGTAAGAVVKLGRDEDVTLGLGICEGIEDGIAILNGGWAPVWCCLSAGTMAAFPILGGIESLTVFGDADAPGRKAAASVVQRWRGAGKEAALAEPPAGLKDFGELHA